MAAASHEKVFLSETAANGGGNLRNYRISSRLFFIFFSAAAVEAALRS